MKIHALSEVQSKNIGKNTTIWQFCVVLAGAKIGSDCNICSHCFIENDVVLGDRVTIKNGVYIFDSIHIEDDVFVGPNVTFTNDLYPKSHRGADRKDIKFPKTFIGKGASIGGGATILPGIKIGHGALIGAGAVVTKDVKPKTVVFGLEAKEIRSISS
jgi:acetyltransferase-like isoleucine patch superfamily enzyme